MHVYRTFPKAVITVLSPSSTMHKSGTCTYSNRHSYCHSITCVQTFAGQLISLLSNRNFSHSPSIHQTFFSHSFLFTILPVGVFTVQFSYGSWFKPSSTTSLIYKKYVQHREINNKVYVSTKATMGLGWPLVTPGFPSRVSNEKNTYTVTT